MDFWFWLAVVVTGLPGLVTAVTGWRGWSNARVTDEIVQRVIARYRERFRLAGEDDEDEREYVQPLEEARKGVARNLLISAIIGAVIFAAAMVVAAERIWHFF